MWGSVSKIDVTKKGHGDADGGAIDGRDHKLWEFGKGLKVRGEGGRLEREREGVRRGFM